MRRLYFSSHLRHARSVRCIFAILFSLVILYPWPLDAQPNWARQGDRANRSGHTFVCEGQGKSDSSALSSALGLCNDKICKVCGVEVESVLKTKESLKGVSMERQVIERCRRVRKKEPVVESKNVDCDKTGCRAWVQVFYSKADEEAECPSYASEKFSDPGHCEADVDDFLRITGRRALDFKARREAMDRAIVDCKDIDVRPTPALTAIEAKLHKGLDSFETTETPSETRSLHDWAYYTHAAQGWRDELRMTKTLVGRLQKIRDLVHDRFLVFSVYDAANDDELDSPPGVQRLLQAMQRCPPGARFGALEDVNIEMLHHLAKATTDTSTIGDYLRRAYPPESLLRLGHSRDMFHNQATNIVAFFATDGKVTSAEWDYAMKAYQASPCVACLSMLTREPNHGSDAIRLQRILAAYEAISKSGSKDHGPADILPDYDEKDPEFLLRVEPTVPDFMHTWYDALTLLRVFSSASELHLSQGLRERLASRYVEALAREPVVEDPSHYCQTLLRRLDDVEKQKIPGADSVYKMLCWCANGKYANGPGQAMADRSLLHGESCFCPMDRKKTVIQLTFGWKKGQTPRRYGRYSEKMAKFSIDVDPTWLACAKKHSQQFDGIGISIYAGTTVEETLSATRSILNLGSHLLSPHYSQEFAGSDLCEHKAAFVAYEIWGHSEFAALLTKRTVLPIHCE